VGAVHGYRGRAGDDCLLVRSNISFGPRLEGGFLGDRRVLSVHAFEYGEVGRANRGEVLGLADQKATLHPVTPSPPTESDFGRVAVLVHLTQGVSVVPSVRSAEVPKARVSDPHFPLNLGVGHVGKSGAELDLGAVDNLG